ncbi:MAG: hypothetical protein ACE5R6_06280 [Candidatus Heimdallarchaeota archaeon]
MEDVAKTMDHYSLVDLTVADPLMWRHINNFQQYYVNRREMSTSPYEWSSRALRIKFLVTLMQSYHSNKIDARQMLRVLLQSQEIFSKLKSIDRNAVQNLRRQLLAHADDHLPHFRALRGKPLERVLKFGRC